MPCSGISTFVLWTRTNSVAVGLVILPPSTECSTVFEIVPTAADVCTIGTSGRRDRTAAARLHCRHVRHLSFLPPPLDRHRRAAACARWPSLLATVPTMAVSEAFCFPLRRAVPCRMVLVRCCCCCVLRMHTEVVPVPVVVTYVVVVSMQQDRNRSTHRNCWTIERRQMSRCDGSHWIIASYGRHTHTQAHTHKHSHNHFTATTCWMQDQNTARIR